MATIILQKKNNETKKVPNELYENSELKLDEIEQKEVEEKKNKEVNETNNKIKKQEKKNKKKELFINFVFLFENILSIIFSFLIFFLSEPLFCFFEILFSGSINFILIEYYSIQKINYFSLSGVICIPQLMYRILELIYSVNKSDKWNIFQIIISFIGVLIASYGVIRIKYNINFCKKDH